MVDPANTFLMSSLAQPIQAPASRVTAPTITTAVTMVAAWISAETGVGPSMASSSQDCNGTCADLPQAPSSNSRPRTVAIVVPMSSAPALTSTNAEDPNVASISMMARDIPMSPTRLTTKAFLAAVAAVGLCCQKPMSRYEAKPTPSQPTNTTR